LWKAKEGKNDNNWRYYQFDGGFKLVKKEDLKDTDYKWAYSKSKGYYIGMKLVLAIEYSSLKPLAFLVFPGGPSDSKIFDKIVDELMRRRILRKGDMFVLDKGFYAYKH